MARSNTESGDGEDHKGGHKREVDRDPQSAHTHEVHESLSDQPHSRLTDGAVRFALVPC